MAIADKSYIGLGTTFWRNKSVAGAGHLAIGNVSEITLTHTETEISQPSYLPEGGKRNTYSKLDSVGISAVLTDFNAENFAVATRGVATTVASSLESGESLTVPAALAVDTLVKTTKPIDLAEDVTVTSDPVGTTFEAGVDYEVVAFGVVVLPGGNISASDALLVTYTSKEVSRVQAIVTSSPEFELSLAAVNKAQQDIPLNLSLHRVKWQLPADLAFVSDEYGRIPLTGELLSDPTKTGTDISKFYVADIA